MAGKCIQHHNEPLAENGKNENMWLSVLQNDPPSSLQSYVYIAKLHVCKRVLNVALVRNSFSKKTK